jgi:hypothetical protein
VRRRVTIYVYYDRAGKRWAGAMGIREHASRCVYRFLYDGRC